MSKQSLNGQGQATSSETLVSNLHGGDIVSASRQYGIDASEWIDLSTGLNPQCYPIAEIPQQIYHQLPYLQPNFVTAFSQYYQSEAGIALIGSQMLIQNLPQCLADYPVLLPDIGYSEYRVNWQKAAAKINSYSAVNLAQTLSTINQAISQNPQQHLVVINPNNPTGVLVAPEQLIAWANSLAPDCYVIVDEAFIDTTPNRSVLAQQWPANMLVLRSFGKFFGLAGVRLGFAFCKGELRQLIEERLGLWMINGPAQFIATKAMLDLNWQQAARDEIQVSASFTQALFAPLLATFCRLSLKKSGEQSTVAKRLGVSSREPDQYGLQSVHQALFSSYYLAENTAVEIQAHFAASAILLRVISIDRWYQGMAILRIGVIKNQDRPAALRISHCIQQYCEKVKN